MGRAVCGTRPGNPAITGEGAGHRPGVPGSALHLDEPQAVGPAVPDLALEDPSRPTFAPASISALTLAGVPNTAATCIGERLDMPRPVVSKWRKRFFLERLAGLEDRSRGGRPPAFSPSGGR